MKKKNYRKNTKKKYYQPEFYYDDGNNIEYIFPSELGSDEVFEDEETCEEWLEKHGYDHRECVIHEYSGDDIEERVFIDANGDTIDINQ